MTINVVDAGCGVGKTTALINKMNNDNSGQKYIYVTPFLDEVSRIQEKCPNRKFASPDESKGSKMRDFIRLLENKRNIVTTHALFRKMNEKIINASLLENYILVMDEVVDTIEEIQITKSDLRILQEKYIKLNNDNKVVWEKSEYQGKLDTYKELIEADNVYAYTDEKNKIVSFVWLLPYNMFTSFKKVFILTYMFDYQIQKKYFDYFKFNLKKWYVKNFELTEEEQVYDYSKQKSLINVCDNKKMNLIGDDYYALSMTWFYRNKHTKNISTIQNNMRNFATRYCMAPSDKVLWTTFQEYKLLVKNKGYAKGFAAINSRATNKYKNKNTVMYIGNRFIKPTLKNFFTSRGIEFDKEFEEQFALSELIQFIYRSCIRDGLPINVYIPSSRMRDLLIDWLKKPND